MTTPRDTLVLPATVPSVTSGDDSYPLLRSTYTTERSPAAILLPRSPSEVADALTHAADTDLPVSVRSGGHGLSGASSNDGGIVIDLSAFSQVQVLDRKSGLVRVGAGARWAQVAAALAPHRLAISSGDHGNVGVGGLATAGGMGWLVRTYGLTIDHVRAATLVLPAGEVVRVDQHEPDLLWAVRGAGSAVGVVTDFDLDAMALPGIHVGQVMIEIDDGGTALARWSEFMASAPRELTMSGLLASAGRRLALVLTAVIADDDPVSANAALAPLLRQPGVHTGGLTAARYTDLMPAAHRHHNLGQQPAITSNALLEQLTPGAAHALLEVARHHLAPFVQVRTIGGATNDLAPDATAYAHRTAEILVTATVFPPRSGDELDAATAPLAPHSVGAYRNFESRPTRESFDRAFPGATGTRVRDLALRYDPDGLLRRMER